jgi:DNA-binding SARP family transcriptional activator
MTDPLLAQVLEGDYEQGLECFAQLDAPSPPQERWAGICLLNLGRLLEARATLLRAKGRGCGPAVIELATTTRLMGDPCRAQAHLQGLDLGALAPFDRALAERERGVIHFALGDLAAARDALEHAWEAAAECPHERALLPGICQTIAYVCLDQGASGTALHYIAHALPHAHPARRVALLVLHGACHLFEGAFTQAGECLALASDAIAQAPQQRPTLLYYLGTLSRYVGRPGLALEHFRASAAASREVQAFNTECYAELGACAVCAEEGDTVQASLHLARAQAITVPARVGALVTLRAAQVGMQQSPECARGLLAGALATFQGLGLHREAGWAGLHLARACQLLGDGAGLRDALGLVTRSRAATGGSRSVALELRGLPDLLPALEAAGSAGALLLGDWHGLTDAAPLLLAVGTLGPPALVLDGTHVRPNASLAKSVELLAYLSLKGGAGLEHILTDVFPERCPQAARVYFHVIRAELARIAPGLSVPFDRARRQYSVATEGLQIRVDLLELQRALHSGGIDGMNRALDLYVGTLLPDSDSEWVREERSNVEWSVVRIGLELIEEAFEQGEDQVCLDLASRLLEIEPFNEAIHLLLIRATARLSGSVAARQAINRSRTYFQTNLGEVPLSIQQLQVTMQA